MVLSRETAGQGHGVPVGIAQDALHDAETPSLTETNWTLGPQSVLCPDPPYLSAATLVSTALSAPFAPSILRALHPHTATARAAHPPPQHGHCNGDQSTLGLHVSAGTGQEGQGPKPQGSGTQRPGCRLGVLLRSECVFPTPACRNSQTCRHVCSWELGAP